MIGYGIHKDNFSKKTKMLDIACITHPIDSELMWKHMDSIQADIEQFHTLKEMNT